MPGKRQCGAGGGWQRSRGAERAPRFNVQPACQNTVGNDLQTQPSPAAVVTTVVVVPAGIERSGRGSRAEGRMSAAPKLLKSPPRRQHTTLSPGTALLQPSRQQSSSEPTQQAAAKPGRQPQRELSPAAVTTTVVAATVTAAVVAAAAAATAAAAAAAGVGGALARKVAHLCVEGGVVKGRGVRGGVAGGGLEARSTWQRVKQL